MFDSSAGCNYFIDGKNLISTSDLELGDEWLNVYINNSLYQIISELFKMNDIVMREFKKDSEK